MLHNKVGEVKSYSLFGRFSLLVLLTFSSTYAETFSEFKRVQLKSFKSYKDEKDNDFSKYLKAKFRAYLVQNSKPLYEKPKPKQILPTNPRKIKPVGPKINLHVKTTEPKESEQKVKEQKVELNVLDKKIVVVSKTKPEIEKTQKDIKFDFFGSELGFDTPNGIKEARFYPQNQEGIANFFDIAASSEYEYILQDIKTLSKKMNLNDWGVYLLIERISDAVFSNKDDSKLFSWFIFNKLGYAVKVGLANRHVVLMHYSKKTIYSTPSYKFSNKNYYVLANYAKKRLGRIYSYPQDYPDSLKDFDLSLETLPILNSAISSKTLSFKHLNKQYSLSFDYDNNLIDFMATYPQADYETFFNAPLDDITYKAIATSLKKYVDGMKASDALNFVLNFVQKAFIYQRDDEQFGREKVMFAQETLYFDKSDCEDRAVLFSYLVKELFSLGVVGVKYSDHMATALYIPMKGDIVKSGSKRLVLADPTYVNASIGQSMPKYKHVQPESFIVVRKN